MKRIALLLLPLLLAASPLCFASYTGDFNPNGPYADAIPNENDAYLGGLPYGAAAYENFIVSGYQHWIIGFWTNNLMDIVPQTAYWELRTGVPYGGGTIIASGTSPDQVTPTGRSAFGYNEYRNYADIGNYFIPLDPGTYWYAVVPQAPDQNGRSFNTNTFGANQDGEFIEDQQYWNAPSQGANFINANYEGYFPLLSGGVTDNFIPEPSSLVLLGTGLVGAAVAVRRRWFI